MRIHPRRGSVVSTLALMLIAVFICCAQSVQSRSTKVSPKNNGSERLVLVTEEIPPGAGISKHKHLGQDEILLIQTGTAHVWLGDQERDLHAGGLVFIPSSTWIRLKNIGTESISLVGIFSAPGFEDFRRCRSVPANEEVTSITPEEIRDCAHQGHLEAFEDTPKN